VKTDPIHARLDWLLAAARDPMLVCDADGVIVRTNMPLATLFGWPLDALVGAPVEILVPPAARGRHAALRGNAGHPRAMGNGSFVAVDQAGHEFPVEISLTPLETAEGRLTLATVHDLRARMSAEQALRDSEARMRAVFETAADGIITIDERGLIERVNPAAERMFGYLEAEIAGRNVSALMPSPDRDRHDGYLQNYCHSGERRIIGKGREVHGLRKDGSIFPMALAVTEMRIGQARMFTGLVRDITARRKSEQETESLVQELRAANEELSNFAYVVSHDLKAPLRAIGSLADWLASDYADRLDDEGREHLRLLIGRVRRMGGLIDGILQYSRLGREGGTLRMVDLNVVVAEVVDLLAPGADLAITVEPGLPALWTEPTRIRQVFHNLLSNAIKYMDKQDGTIAVGCRDEGECWRFSVADNGPGIERRHFERIFQLFQTLAPRDRVESTGVGLAIVRKIVDTLGGRVWVDSTPGHGSTFHFTIPKAMRKRQLDSQ
jgi:PAS domain S-box-containing protein